MYRRNFFKGVSKGFLQGVFVKREIKTCCAAQTEAAGEQLGKELAEKNKPEVVAFFGGMGMGKTAFIRGLCRGVGYDGDVSSPTFAIVHEYEGGKKTVYHFDMYRISGVEDLYSCGFFDYLGQGILAVEWSENIVGALPDDCLKVEIKRGDGDDCRIITVERMGEQADPAGQ